MREPVQPLDSLRELIAVLAAGNRFYAPRLAAAGIDARIASLEEYCTRLPFTTKADLVADQTANPPHGTNLSFPIERYTRFCQTSGTTARPLVILDTPESWAWMLGNWAHIYRAAGLAPGDRIYFAFSFGPFLGFWTAFEAASKLSFLCIPGGGLGSAGRLRALIEHRATVLCCTPTYARRLAEVAATEGIDLTQSAICKIIVAGEPGGSVPAVREKIEKVWNGAHLIDHYGMTEVGPVAYQDAARQGLLRIIEESYFAEIIDPKTGTAVPPGETGELVLTTLGRHACPLLRYRTGDLVQRNPDEPGFALEGGIIGRVDDMIVVRGVNIFPSALDAVVRSVHGVVEYRVEVNRRGALAEVAVQIESLEAGAVERLETALASAFSLRIPVALVETGALPRFEMKARRWVTPGVKQ
jgi:phenylacetate-CoA ligase